MDLSKLQRGEFIALLGGGLLLVGLAAALAPLALAYIILRDHVLSWPRGELTAVIAIAA